MLQQFNPLNKDLYIYVNGEILHRDGAKISVFDSSVQGGDAVWEGLRLYKEGIICLDRHLKRLQNSAKALMFDVIPQKDTIVEAIKSTLVKNNMQDNVHIRLTLTRGEKYTSGMDPRLNNKGCGLIIIPEWKTPVYDNRSGISVITSSIRRNAPDFLDSKIHHNNLLNNILAKIQANYAGADAALMLDKLGFAAELNGTNIFMSAGNVLYTPYGDACLPGITRGLVIELAESMAIKVVEKNISLTELYTADEVFATGTMGELTPIIKIDGRIIPFPEPLGIFAKIRKSFEQKLKHYCEKVL